MQAVEVTPLMRIRGDLGVSREKLIRRTQTVSAGTVRNAEFGRRITYANATQILSALNAILSESGKSPVTLDDLNLALY
jgi:hypothetical protein